MTVVNNNLVVIGAGPKALAIHIKSYVLREMGHKAPDVIIIEKSAIGANWSGDFGYTDGTQKIVTSADSDLGFPYESDFGRDVDLRISQYSWHAFQISRRAIGPWIIEGRKNISHSDFAKYLCWVADRSGADIRIGEVKANGIRCIGKEWVIEYTPEGAKPVVTLHASGLVVTGPGEPRRLTGRQPPHPDISDSRSFWEKDRQTNLKDVDTGHVAVVGSGDTAGTAVITLLDQLPKGNSAKIHLFCGTSEPIPRLAHESVDNLDAYPGIWLQWSPEKRKAYLLSTQRGVFSNPQMAAVTEAKREGIVICHIGFVFGAEVQVDDGKPVIQLFHMPNKRGRSDTVEAFPEKFRRVVIATGFQRYSFEHWFHGGEFFGPREFKDVSKEVKKKDKLKKNNFGTWKDNWIARKIMEDLSYRNCEMRWPSAMLYLPTLAGFSCGPGFPTLGCLGRVSDQIISSHLLFVGNSQEKI